MYNDEIALTGSGEGEFGFTVSWSLQLGLIDAPGQPNLDDPGSGAAVDPGCTNNGKGTSQPTSSNVVVIEDSSAPVMFTWFHPASDVTPPGQPAGVYNCDHLKQGPRGHQGTVTLTVSGAGETCVVAYKGTDSGAGSDPGQPGVQSCHAASGAAASPSPS